MGKCENKDELFTQAVNKLIATGDMTVAQKTVNQSVAKSLQQGGLQEWNILSLAALSPVSATQVRYESSGAWLYLAKSGTAPGAQFSVELTGGQTLTKVVPGTLIRGNFEGFNLTNTGSTVGAARFIIGQTNDVDYDEEFIEGNSTNSAIASSYTATYNGTSDVTNIPSGVMAGAVPLRNGKAVRAMISSPTNIVACTGRWWLQNNKGVFTANAWFKTNNVETFPTGVTLVASQDWPIGVENGFAFLELYSNTNSGGSGAFTVLLEVL